MGARLGRTSVLAVPVLLFFLPGCDDETPLAALPRRRAQVLAAHLVTAPPATEQPLDTDVAPRAARPVPGARPPRPPRPAPAPASTNRKVRTPADEDLPPWVPIAGRLTVVESSDMAENLGLVPIGSARKSAERISVADLLEAERLRRLAAEADAGAPAFTYIPGGAFVSHL